MKSYRIEVWGGGNLSMEERRGIAREIAKTLGQQYGAVKTSRSSYTSRWTIWLTDDRDIDAFVADALPKLELRLNPIVPRLDDIDRTYRIVFFEHVMRHFKPVGV